MALEIYAMWGSSDASVGTKRDMKRATLFFNAAGLKHTRRRRVGGDEIAEGGSE